MENGALIQLRHVEELNPVVLVMTKLIRGTKWLGQRQMFLIVALNKETFVMPGLKKAALSRQFNQTTQLKCHHQLAMIKKPAQILEENAEHQALVRGTTKQKLIFVQAIIIVFVVLLNVGKDVLMKGLKVEANPIVIVVQSKPNHPAGKLIRETKQLLLLIVQHAQFIKKPQQAKHKMEAAQQMEELPKDQVNIQFGKFMKQEKLVLQLHPKILPRQPKNHQPRHSLKKVAIKPVLTTVHAKVL